MMINGQHAKPQTPLDQAVLRIVELLNETERLQLAEYVRGERINASQSEWERWKRANGVAGAAIRQTAIDIRALAKRLDCDAVDLRDLERMAATLEAAAEQMDGENWLKSPLAMAEQREQEHQAGAAVGGRSNVPTPSANTGERLTP